MPDPTVTVILPVRNGARFIAQALESAVAQTYPHLEIIVVDGASNDGTPDIVRAFPTVRLVSEPDRGQAEAMNKGIERSSGDIITILCADDVLNRDAVRTAVAAFAASPEADVVFGNVGKIDEAGRIVSSGERFAPFTITRALLQHAGPPATNYPSTSAFLRRRLLDEVNFRFDEDLPTAADFDMWLRLGLRAEVKYVPEVAAYWREHADSGSVRADFRPAIRLSMHRSLDKFFVAQPGFQQLESQAHAMVEVVSHGCFLLSTGQVGPGIRVLGGIVRRTPAVARRLHAYRLVGRALTVGLLRRFGLHRRARVAREIIRGGHGRRFRRTRVRT